MKRFWTKHRILQYMITSYAKFLLLFAVGFAIFFGVLIYTGLYTNLESALDLRYNSPFILAPLFGSLALFIVCLFIGILLYMHKYKRPIKKRKYLRR